MLRRIKILILLLIALLIIGVFILRFLESSGFFDHFERCITVGDDYSSWEEVDVFIDDDFNLNSCESNFFNCSNFCTQEDAQKILEGCAFVDNLDINELDLDGDGVACESLP